MSNKSDELIEYMKESGRIIRFSDILDAGFHPDTIKHLVDKNRIIKPARGLYTLESNMPKQHPDLVLANLQAPGGVICLISALSFYNATSDIPSHVDIALEKGAGEYRINYPPVKYYHFSSKSYSAGISMHQIDGYRVKIYNLAKTIADCFKFRNQIGIDTATEGLKIAVTEHNVHPNKIMEYARICRVHNIIKPKLETLI